MSMSLSTNYNVDSADGWIARYFFDGLRQLAPGKPMLISEWFFAAHENRSGNRNNGHLMTVPTQAERTRGAMAAAQRFAREPQIVGIHWFQYYDHPTEGVMMARIITLALSTSTTAPMKRLVEAFSRVNPSLADLHQQRRETHPRLQSRPIHGRFLEAAIDARDHSLGEWPKERALDASTDRPPPEIAFRGFLPGLEPNWLASGDDRHGLL